MPLLIVYTTCSVDEVLDKIESKKFYIKEDSGRIPIDQYDFVI